MWNFKITTDWGQIWNNSFQKQWQELLDASPTSHVFFHPTVAKVWVDTYMPLRKMDALFVWGKTESNSVFMPLVLWYRNWKSAFVKSIIPVGYSDYDYHDPLFLHSVSKDELCTFWGELLQELQKWGADEICINGITDSSVTEGESWKKGEICPCLNIAGMKREPDLMTFFDTKLRGDIRRQKRRLNEIAFLEFKEYIDGQDIPNEVFEAFMDAHRKKWPNAYKAPRFHQNLINQCRPGGPIHFSTLNVGDTVVAWHLGFDFKGTYYYYMPAGNPEYKNFSPVKVHLYHLICRAIERGNTKYDHLRGDETYKSGWADGSQYVNTLFASRDCLTTKLKKNVLNLRSIIKK